MLLIQKILKKIIKIIFKQFFICILIAYTPLPFFDILNFYNQDDPLKFDSEDADDTEQNEEQKNKWFKVKVILCVVSAALLAYIIYKINTEAPPGGAVAPKSKKTSTSNPYQDQIMQKRVENALSATRKILEIKKKV